MLAFKLLTETSYTLYRFTYIHLLLPPAWCLYTAFCDEGTTCPGMFRGTAFALNYISFTSLFWPLITQRHNCFKLFSISIDDYVTGLRFVALQDIDFWCAHKLLKFKKCIPLAIVVCIAVVMCIAFNPSFHSV